MSIDSFTDKPDDKGPGVGYIVFQKICEYKGYSIIKSSIEEHGYFVVQPPSLLKHGSARLNKDKLESDLIAMQWIDQHLADKE